MKKHGLEENIRISRDKALLGGGRNATLKLLESHIPQAIYCANDYMAAGALQVLHEKGLSVPQDIAVIGNDNMEICDYLCPMLTTVSLGLEEAGELAVKKLFSIIRGEEEQDAVIKPVLVERQSTENLK